MTKFNHRLALVSEFLKLYIKFFLQHELNNLSIHMRKNQ